METIQGTSAAALALTICPQLTEHLRLETKYFCNFRTLHTHYKLLCHFCFQMTLILRPACKRPALKLISTNWVKVNKCKQLRDKQDRAVPALLPGSPPILSGPSLLLHVLCQTPAARTVTSLSPQLYNILSNHSKIKLIFTSWRLRATQTVLPTSEIRHSIQIWSHLCNIQQSFHYISIKITVNAMNN